MKKIIMILAICGLAISSMSSAALAGKHGWGRGVHLSFNSHGHHHRRHHYVYVKKSCKWYKRKFKRTHKIYWWKKYEHCLAKYY